MRDEAEMFIGRERELRVLRAHYDSGSFEFVGLYGRRRVGKTALLGEFVRDVPYGWCTAVEDDASANLRLLSQAVYALSNPEANPEDAPDYADFRSALEAAFEATSHRRAVLVIDEFPYLAKSDPSFPSVLQSAIDRHHQSSGMFLVLCGSSLSFMKEQLLDKKSPLYGRRTAQLELRPFDFFDARRFFPDLDAKTAAEIYGMVGGIPLYLRQFKGCETLAENVGRVFLDPSSILFEEAANLLKQEVSKAAPYNAVISAIAGGASQHNEIALRAGIESSAVDYFLKELVRMGLVVREAPVTGKGGRKAVWHLSDNLFRFWFRFVRPRQSLVERGLGARASQRILDEFPACMGMVFEEICRDWLWRQYEQGVLPFDIVDIGRWWGNDPKARAEAEIDIVAMGDASPIMVGECKWRGEPTGIEQLSKLNDRAWLVGADDEVPRWMFSLSEFTPSCENLARALPSARLITFDEMARG